MLWQTPLDGILAVYEGFAPEGITESYDSSMAVGKGGSMGDGLIWAHSQAINDKQLIRELTMISFIMNLQPSVYRRAI